MTNNEIKFLEYLDKAVLWEKEKQIAIKNASKPFNKTEILDIVEDFELSKLKTNKDCLERMKMLKVVNNVFVRRMFLSLIRENFKNINFANLTTNPRYIQIRNEILGKYPELTFVDDDKFLRQIGNAFAHGNYNSLFDMEKLENIWQIGEDDRVIDFKKREEVNIHQAYFNGEEFEKDDNYNEKVNNIRKTKYEALKNGHKISTLRLYLNILNGTMDSDKIVETLNFRYESNRMLDASGNVVDRPAPVNFELSINRSQLDDLILVLVSEKESKGYISQEAISMRGCLTEIPANANDEDVAKYILSNHKYYLCELKTNQNSELVFDAQQTKLFINEYVNSRQWFGQDFFGNLKNPMLQDYLATNQNSHLLALTEFYYPDQMNLAATSISLDNVESLFDLAAQRLRSYRGKDLLTTLAGMGEYVYNLTQVFNSYTETLITETLLILQLIEDNQLFTICESNIGLSNIVSSLNQAEILKLRTSPKYKNDVHSILYHLRDSFSHLMYLNNLNDELFIYDYVSKKNKTPDFKFTISVENLERIKNQLLNIVKTHIIQANNSNDVNQVKDDGVEV